MGGADNGIPEDANEALFDVTLSGSHNSTPWCSRINFAFLLRHILVVQESQLEPLSSLLLRQRHPNLVAQNDLIYAGYYD